MTLFKEIAVRFVRGRFVVVFSQLFWILAGPLQAELVYVENPDPNTSGLYQLTVSPSAESVPAFRYRLVAQPHKLKEGNAAAYYRRIASENMLNGTSRRLNESTDEQWYDWINADVPISQLPIHQVRKAAKIAEVVVRNGVLAGTECKRCDWGLPVENLRGFHSILFLLPEFQQMRQLSRLTALETRLAIAEQRYSDAIDLMRAQYRMAADTAQMPYLVCGLIGIAITGIADNNMLDLIAAPNSPNLYWALSELPDPLISLRQAVRLEMSLGTRIFEVLEDAETAVRAPDEWNRVFQEAHSVMPELASGSLSDTNHFAASFGGLPAAILGYTHAKRRLVDWGYEEDRVEEMPVGQVIAIYSSRVYQIRADEQEKIWNVPFPEYRQFVDRAEEQLTGRGPLSGDPDRELIGLAQVLLPASIPARNAQMRAIREIALLRAIEAIRMHAAENGELPATLEEVTCVPVPKNPATDSSFQYELKNNVATFVLLESEGVVMGGKRIYEIRLADE